MAIPDKIGAANKINELLSGIVKHGGLRLKYRITVDPPMAEERDWERPEILVEFAGPDSPLLLGRGAELLRAIEFLAIEILRLPGNENEKVCFDCMNHRSMRLKNCASPQAWLRRKFARAERRTSLLPCHHGSGALCILRCGIIPICARKAKATGCDGM